MMSQTDPLYAERRAKMRRFLTAVAVVLVLGGVAYGVYTVTLGRQLLKGESTLDFGIIEYDTYGAKVSGEFALVNTLSETMTIARVSPTCGCTTMETGPFTVEPGATWTLPIEFTVTKPGLKEAAIKVLMDGHGTQTLHVRGIGRDMRMLTSPQANGLVLRPGLPSIMSVNAIVYDETEPPALEVAEAPDNVDVLVIGWERRPYQHKGAYEPVIWTTQVEVRLEGGDPVTDQSIVFQALGTDQSITIPINPDLSSMSVDSPAANR